MGGDPAELMSYMVRSKSRAFLEIFCTQLMTPVADPGLLPGFASLTNGDIPKKRKMLAEVRFAR